MKSALSQRIAAAALAVALIPASAPTASAALAAGCSQVALTIGLDRPIDLGTVTLRWGAYSLTVAHPTTNTTAPFTYSGTIVAPVPSYAGAWGYRVTVGSDVMFESSDLGYVSLGHAGEGCVADDAVGFAAGIVGIRVFRDPSGSGADPELDWSTFEWSQPGIAGVPVHVCALPVNGTSCIAGSEAALASPRATDGSESVAYFTRLEGGRYKIWHDVLPGMVTTYPRAGSWPSDCGASCVAYDGAWIVSGGGWSYLQFGDFDRRDCGQRTDSWRRSPCARLADLR